MCVFLFGGVDGNSLVVPLDAAGYARYSAVRTVGSGLNVAQSSLLPVQPAGGGPAYGLHPALSGIHPLFGEGRLAILANVGTLNEPTTRSNYLAARPDSLYSHADQQSQWQSSVSSGASATGWGGRLADRLAERNAASGFPVVTSIAGTNLFLTGQASAPLAVAATGGLALSGFNGGTAANARLAAMRAILAADADNTYVKATGDISARALSLSGVVNPSLPPRIPVSRCRSRGRTSAIAQQLLQVAKLIEARGATGARRQVFFVSLGGFDTHAAELATLDTLLGQLGPALKAFHDATQLLGVADQVTTFTLSDFGRTFQPASGAGTDHAWGNHHFILGGAVRGGATVRPLSRHSCAAVPTTPTPRAAGSRRPRSTSTARRWRGGSAPATSDLAAVFPNLSRFPTPDLGFLA